MDALHYVMARLKTAQIVRDEEGVTALEYALLASLIGVAIVATVTTFGTSLSAFFGGLPGKLNLTTSK